MKKDGLSGIIDLHGGDKVTVRYILICAEVLLLFWFFVSFPVFCAGNVAGIFASLCLLFVTAKWEGFCGFIKKTWESSFGKAVIVISGVIIATAVIYVIVLSVFMVKAQEKKPDKPNAVVVLGCKVNGTNPSRMLRRRLDRAYEVLEENKDAVCIVSGGQGANEKCSEAEAMKKYLVEKGIDGKRIVEEDKSTDTEENIRFSLEKLDELGKPHDITIVTDGFHQLRASLIAKKQGVENVTAYSAYTEPRFVASYWVREWLALTEFFIFG